MDSFPYRGEGISEYAIEKLLENSPLNHPIHQSCQVLSRTNVAKLILSLLKGIVENSFEGKDFLD